MNAGQFWQPSMTVAQAIKRGEKRFVEWRKRLVAEAEVGRRVELERRRQQQ
jgi:hypothetical protein